jgi:Spy/CpxP family protein refolding chaperone
MKKVILTAAAAFTLFTTTFAQTATIPAPKVKMAKSKPAAETPAQGTPAAEVGKAKGQGKGKGQGQGGLKELGLTPEQETQFKAVNQAHKSAVKAVQADATLAADAKKAQVAALVTKYQSDVQGIMNADQFAKWSAARNKPKNKGGDHKKGDHKMDAPTDDAAAPAEGARKGKKKKEHN